MGVAGRPRLATTESHARARALQRHLASPLNRYNIVYGFQVTSLSSVSPYGYAYPGCGFNYVKKSPRLLFMKLRTLTHIQTMVHPLCVLRAVLRVAHTHTHTRLPRDDVDGSLLTPVFR